MSILPKRRRRFDASEPAPGLPPVEAMREELGRAEADLQVSAEGTTSIWRYIPVPAGNFRTLCRSR